MLTSQHVEANYNSIQMIQSSELLLDQQVAYVVVQSCKRVRDLHEGLRVSQLRWDELEEQYNRMVLKYQRLYSESAQSEGIPLQLADPISRVIKTPLHAHTLSGSQRQEMVAEKRPSRVSERGRH